MNENEKIAHKISDLFKGKYGPVIDAIAAALDAKDAEIDSLRTQLEAAKSEVEQAKKACEFYMARIEEWSVKVDMMIEAHEGSANTIAALELEITHLREAQAKVCEWTYDDDHCFYDSSCGDAWTLIDGTPHSNNYRFCPGCGGTISVVTKEG